MLTEEALGGLFTRATVVTVTVTDPELSRLPSETTYVKPSLPENPEDGV
jgi:hypothetical protein